MKNTDEITRQIEAMPENEIAPVAEQALAGTAIDRELKRQVQPLDVVSTGNGTVGLWRVSGDAVSNGEIRSWSAILKILNPSLPNNFDSGMGASKEISAIESGDLLAINTGIRQVPIFDFAAQDDGSYWLWMRDLSDGVQPPWDGDQYIETARHVGQFNNLWTEQDRPKGDWITTDMSTDRRTPVSQSLGPQVESLISYRDHPNVERLVEGIGLARVLRMPDDIARIIESTHDLPRTVAHNDLHARNLFPREENGERITYAIGWASVGLGPVGVDAGSLAGAAITWIQSEAEMIEEYESHIFAAYVEGLRDSGWRGDESEVRLAYLSQFVTYILFFPYITLVTILPEHRRKEFFRRRLGVDDRTAVDQVSQRLSAFIHLIDEALELAKKL